MSEIDLWFSDVTMIDLVIWTIKICFGFFLALVVWVWVMILVSFTRSEVITMVLSVGSAVGFFYFLLFHAGIWVWLIMTVLYVFAALTGLAGPYSWRG